MIVRILIRFSISTLRAKLTVLFKNQVYLVFVLKSLVLGPLITSSSL